METIIDIYYKENVEILEYLESKNEISFKASTDVKLKKILVLYIASYFEVEICSVIHSYVKRETSGDFISSLVQNKAIKRQYHTFFSWESNNANSFFGMFGKDFKLKASKEIASNGLEQSISAFLELGRIRNEMVHQNAGVYVVDKTTEEVYEIYKEAEKFLVFVRRIFDTGFIEEVPQS